MFNSIDEQVEHLVDTVPMSYVEARMILGIPEPDYTSVAEYHYPTPAEQDMINARGLAMARAALAGAKSRTTPESYESIA